MASRKDQKAELRREREEREAAAKAAERRRRLIGYGAGAAVVLAALIVAGVLLASGGDDGGGDGGGGGGDVLPTDGKVPDQKVTDLDEAVKAAGCRLQSVQAKSRDHSDTLTEKIAYDTKPPTSGKHYEIPAEDGDYESAPNPQELVHSLEHGRVIVWFKKDLPRDERANLKALFDEDEYQMILTPDTTGMTYAVAATAWNADPQPNGTGRLLGCPRFTPGVYDAIRAFKDEHRSNGPEAVP